MSTKTSATGIQLEIENVGGIEHQEITIDPGLTVLSGENATNRTSLLKAVMALAGSDEPPIRSGTERGYVKGEINGESYEREVTATATGGYSWSGEGYCDDPLLAELYSFLLEQNDVRQTVSSGGDLRELIMRPVDTDEIEAREDELAERKRELEGREDKIEVQKAQIERLKQTISDLTEDKKDLIDQKKDVERQIEEFDGDVSQQQSKLDESNDIQSQIRDVSRDISDLNSELRTAKSDLENRREELSRLEVGDEDDIAELNEEIRECQQQIDDLESEQSKLDDKKQTLSPLRSFLTSITGGTDVAEINQIISEYSDVSRTASGSGSESVTDELISGSDDDELCVLCGAEIDPDHYEKLERSVANAMNSLNSKDDEIADDISDLTSKKKRLKQKIRDIQNTQERMESLEEDIKDFEAEIQSIEAEIEDLKSQKSELEDEHEEVQQGLENDVQELIGLNKKQTELETKIDDKESTVDSRKEDLESAKDKLDELKEDAGELDAVKEELNRVRNKVSEIEKSVVEQFNDRMDEVLNRLGYSGIERIWIQDRMVEKRKGRRKVEETVFDLNIVREIDGKTTQDTIDNLSESEREVTGLIFALTGFLVHDVDEVFPVTLMDSIEMVDSNRIEELLRYFDQYTEYLIVAALPADADQIDVGEGAILEMAN